ncbi:glycoside hydrolase family 36 protein [Microbacterium sp. 22195]|uniref:glycoside hydrolase family 36 protein n=1 Tax=Microbacterium sp. 22195 TaxID=3453891 RepID=UPI003F832D42
MSTALDSQPRVADSCAMIGAFRLHWSGCAPASLTADLPGIGRDSVALVEIFSASEHRARTSQAYVRSAIGSRLRIRSVDRAVDDDASVLVAVQRDDETGIEVSTTIRTTQGARTVRMQHVIRNTGAEALVLTAVSSATIGFGSKEADLDPARLLTARSEWLAEDRWVDRPLREALPSLSLPIHAQDGRGRYAIVSHGSWSTGEHLPVGVLLASSDPEAPALAWQLETSAGWCADMSQGAEGAALSLLGPTDLEHQFAQVLAPGESLLTEPVALAAVRGGADAAFAELTRYRRSIRWEPESATLPVIYNDFMNTLMGQPSTEALLPLVDAAADAGVEVFCVDAGWFADPELGDWWSTVGEWQEAETRFSGGLTQITDRIAARGMRVGLWLEPEVVGVDSAAASTLPEQAFFRRYGRPVVEHRRLHLDFRHPAARAHADDAVDRVIADYGATYLKLDYNINPGVGTEVDAAAPGAGLLGHARAYREWLIAVQQRHPGVLIENCSSGAMRADYGLLAVSHLQSTSDQQDHRLYPPIAASAPASILPEQCGNWAYPAEPMSDAETAFTLVTGLSGRLYLSGFLDQLRPEQTALLSEAVSLHKSLRRDLTSAEPFWPRGLPGWEDEVVCLGLRGAAGTLLFVWDRSEDAAEFVIPGIRGTADQVFPSRDGSWQLDAVSSGLRIRTGCGIGARVLHVAEAGS